MDKDIVAPIGWRDEAMAFGAGKTFAHTSKRGTLSCTSRSEEKEAERLKTVKGERKFQTMSN